MRETIFISFVFLTCFALCFFMINYIKNQECEDKNIISKEEYTKTIYVGKNSISITSEKGFYGCSK